MGLSADFIQKYIYIAGFTQINAPHLGLLILWSANASVFYHIRVDRQTSPNWQFQRHKQAIYPAIFLTSLLRINAGKIDEARLKAAAEAIPPPTNDTLGECAP
jgi:hypothetical protein